MQNPCGVEAHSPWLWIFVTGALVTGALVSGALVMGALVTGALVRGAFVVGESDCESSLH